MIDFSQIEARLEKIAGQRTRLSRKDRAHTIELWEQNRPLEAETSAQRQKAAQERSENDIGVDRLARARPRAEAAEAAEAAKGPRDNFIPVSFLERGARVARAVARVSLLGGRRTGTGFLVSPNLFITNFHVIPDTAHAGMADIQFDFQDDIMGRARHTTVFSFDPHKCFVADDVDGLDYAVIAVNSQGNGPAIIDELGFIPLSGSGSKHALGEFANIIQHPDGRPKEVVLQDNLIAGRVEQALHYVADTLPGSSGSPVFNNNWQVIALHHWGAAKDSVVDTAGGYSVDSVNEGIRISRIVSNLLERQDSLSAEARALVQQALSYSVGPPEESSHRGMKQSRTSGPVSRTNRDGSVTWQVPLEVTVNIPGLAGGGAPAPDAVANSSSAPSGGDAYRPTGGLGAAEARAIQALAASDGYQRNFLAGPMVDLPVPNRALSRKLATLKPEYRKPGRKTYELCYTHFSVVMHAERRLPLFTAVNIDGPSLFGLARGTDDRYSYDDNRAALRRRILAEAESSSWFFDDRIEREQQTGKHFYDTRDNNIAVPPFDQDYKSPVDFQRGHVVRRLDPVWGTLEQGMAADADSHAWTNVAPHTAQFNANNRNSADVQPGEEKRLWAALENAILRTAFDDKQRISVFSGPVFDDDDPVYAGRTIDGELTDRCKVPLLFWKVVVWQRDNEIRALALKASQKASLLKPGAGPEALDSADEIFILRDFVTTVADVEGLTGLRFDKNVGDGDVWKGQEGVQASTLTERQILEILIA